MKNIKIEDTAMKYAILILCLFWLYPGMIVMGMIENVPMGQLIKTLGYMLPFVVAAQLVWYAVYRFLLGAVDVTNRLKSGELEL